MNEDEWREELRRLYDEAYEKKHASQMVELLQGITRRSHRPEDPPNEDPGDTGGVREPRRPRPQKPSGHAAMPTPTEARQQRMADVEMLGEDPKFLERVSQAMEFFGVKGVD